MGHWEGSPERSDPSVAPKRIGGILQCRILQGQ